MLKYIYSNIDLPLSRACGARTDVTGRLEQSRLDVWSPRNKARRRPRSKDFSSQLASGM